MFLLFVLVCLNPSDIFWFKGRTEEAEEIVRKLEAKAERETLAFDKNNELSEHENYEPSLATIWSGRFWKRTVMLGLPGLA